MTFYSDLFCSCFSKIVSYNAQLTLNIDDKNEAVKNMKSALKLIIAEAWSDTTASQYY